jgi:carboxymethylenebutenolidase
MGEMIAWASGEGEARGYLTVPDGLGRGEAPGILVLHAWWGLTPFFQRVCDRLSALGYVALGADLHGGETAATEAEAGRLLKAVPGPRRAAWVEAAAATLRAHPLVGSRPLAVIGFSMGGAWALHLSAVRPDDIAAVVLFYGSGDDEDVTASDAAYLGHFAVADPWEPLDAVRHRERWLRAAGREVRFHLYPDAGHWFFEDDRPDAFDAHAAAQARERTVAFLAGRLGQSDTVARS